MLQQIRLFLLVEAAAFTMAALIHGGVLTGEYIHREARIAETVVAAVLLLGLAVSWIRPMLTRSAGLIAQGFALVGTVVGIVTIAVGVGPQTTSDIVYHVGMVAVLIWGLVVARRAPKNG